MSVVYVVNKGLYINLTNKCRNNCDFCVRLECDSVGNADTLWLEKEPTKEEVWNELIKWDIYGYSELVFCGFGEPTERLEELLWLCSEIRRMYPGVRIRLNTNGHASLIAGKDVTSLFAGLVDCVSISLNYPNAEEYFIHCKPDFGKPTFEAILEFARGIKRQGIDTIFSVVDGTADIEKTRILASQNEIPLRVRSKI